MRKDSNVVNIFGILFLIYMCLEYLLVMGDISIQLHLVLLLMFGIYYFIFKTCKLKYINKDDIIAWLLMSVISIPLFIGIKHFGFMVSCTSNFCLEGFRDYAFIASNLFFAGVLIIINMFSFIARVLFLKKKSRKF